MLSPKRNLENIMYLRSKPGGKNQGQTLDLRANTSRGGAVILRKKS